MDSVNETLEMQEADPAGQPSRLFSISRPTILNSLRNIPTSNNYQGQWNAAYEPEIDYNTIKETNIADVVRKNAIHFRSRDNKSDEIPIYGELDADYDDDESREKDYQDGDSTPSTGHFRPGRVKRSNSGDSSHGFQDGGNDGGL